MPGLELRRRASSVVEFTETKLSALPPTLARLTVGYAFLVTGWGKLHNLDKVTEFFGSLSIPAPGFHAVFVSCVEFGCGLLLLLGLATRLAALPLIGTMVVALSTALAPDIEDLSSLFGTVEFTYIALLVWLAVRGAGPLSLDHWLTRGSPRIRPTSEPSTLSTSTT